MALSGLPNWTFDIGGFAVEKRYEDHDPAHLPEWRELNTRWFQFGAFVPIFRSHGQFPYREIWNIAPEGTPFYESMAYYNRLRYALLPYLYSLAGDTYQRDGVIMRGMMMDFPNDPKVRDINDQYLFGPAFLVAPVTRFGATSRQVYLRPAAAGWISLPASVMKVARASLLPHRSNACRCSCVPVPSCRPDRCRNTWTRSPTHRLL